MNDRFEIRFRKTAATLAALLLVLSVLGPIGTVAAAPGVSVTQSEASTTAAPGETVTLQTTITATNVNGPGLQVQLPNGWLGTTTDADGGASKPVSGNANHLEVIWFASGTYTVTYEVHVPADAAAGEYAVEVDGSAINPVDGGRIVTETATTVTVEEEQTNSPPAADAGSDQTVDEGDSVSLDASGSSDPDGDSLSYSWSQTGGDDVSLSDASSAMPTFTAPDVDTDQTVTFAVEVSDGNGGTATDTVEITVENADQLSPDPSLETSVSLSPSSAETVVGGTETFDVVVETTDGGVGAYTVTISVADSSVATIADVELLGSPGLEDIQIAPDGSSVTINAAQMSTANTGSVTIATVTVEGVAEGQSDLSLAVDALGTENGQSYTVAGTSGASLDVIALGPIGDFANPPNDPDGDGVYEDTNGDGAFNIVDVQATFANMNHPTIQNNQAKFDFNGDGKFDIVDVQAQFVELIS